MLSDIHNLPLVEKVKLVEELWDEICASSEPFPLQPWHEQKARERASDLDADPSIAIDRTELWQRVKPDDEK